MTERIPVTDPIGNPDEINEQQARAAEPEKLVQSSFMGDGAGSQDAPESTPKKNGNRTGHSGRPARPRRTLRRLIPPGISREEALRRLEAFYRITRVVADSDNDVDALVHATARLCAEALGDMSTVALLNMRGETYHVAAYYDPDPYIVSLFERTLGDLPSIPRAQGWIASVIDTGNPLLIPSITVEEVGIAAVPSLMQFAREVGLSSMLIVPISGNSGTLGALAMTRHAGGQPYTEEDQYFMLEMGYRLGLAIEDAMLVASLRKEVGARLFAREALAASEERFLSIFRSTPLGIKVMDLVGSILETNTALQNMAGYEETVLIAMHFYDFVHPDDAVKVMRAFTELKTRRKPKVTVEHRLISKDGATVWVQTTFAGVKRGAGDDTLALIFGIVEDITPRKQAEVELRELKKHLQRSIEMERLRIAQNLHDVPLQELYTVIYRLEELKPKAQPANAQIIGEVIADIKKTLDGLRATATELRPPALSRFGLEKAIRSYAQEFREKHPEVQVELTLARDALLLPEDMRLVLFRVFQEAMTNMLRHSDATKVQVHFSFDAEEARLEVSDNGKGFAVPDNWMTDVREGHYGLAGMAERVSGTGGTLTLESRPDGGTIVRAVIPC